MSYERALSRFLKRIGEDFEHSELILS